MNSPPRETTFWTESYEALRRHILEGRQVLGTDPLGLVLLVRQGVAGWMQGWSEWISPSCSRSVAPPVVPALPTVWWQNQLTVLLAHMATPHLQPE